MSDKLYDKNGNAIEILDLLKVFHFTGARRKKHYMYKHVIDIVELGKDENKAKYYKISSLSHCGHTYYEKIDGRTMGDYEIIQKGQTNSLPTGHITVGRLTVRVDKEGKPMIDESVKNDR